MSRKRQSHNPVWLQARGYDGLYATEGPCGCGVDDFAPCGEGPFPECVPAELRDDGLFHPAKRKRIMVAEQLPQGTGEEIEQTGAEK